MDKKELDKMLRAADITEILMLHGRYITYLDQIDFLSIYSTMAQDHPEISYEMVESEPFLIMGMFRLRGNSWFTSDREIIT